MSQSLQLIVAFIGLALCVVALVKIHNDCAYDDHAEKGELV